MPAPDSHPTPTVGMQLAAAYDPDAPILSVEQGMRGVLGGIRSETAFVDASVVDTNPLTLTVSRAATAFVMVGLRILETGANAGTYSLYGSLRETPDPVTTGGGDRWQLISGPTAIAGGATEVLGLDGSVGVHYLHLGLVIASDDAAGAPMTVTAELIGT